MSQRINHPEPMTPERLEALKEWGNRIEACRLELQFLLWHRAAIDPAVFAVQAAMQHLASVKYRLYDEVFLIFPGATVVFNSEVTLPETDAKQVIKTVDNAGLIEYESGLVDNVRTLRELLANNLAKIYVDLGAEPPEPGNSTN